MGQVLHGSAKTTHAVRAEIQRSKASIRELSQRYGINPNTVQKWRRRDSVEDRKMGPKNPRSTVLSVQEEALIAAFRRHTLLPLDDCLYALQPIIPKLTRSSLHRCLQRHGISRLPAAAGSGKPARKRFQRYPIGYFHIDITHLRTAEGKLYLFVAIDRTAKFVFARAHPRANQATAAQFLRELVAALPYKLHTVLTDNGGQFTNRRVKAARPNAHCFAQVCAQQGIAHRLTQPYHPWTNGQVERINRTIKQATVQRYHYSSHQQFREHLDCFLSAYNFARRLKSLNGSTPHQFLCNTFSSQPHRFLTNPSHHSMGLNNYPLAATAA